MGQVHCIFFWCADLRSGTGGGISIRHNDVLYIAPSGVQKERMYKEDMFVMDGSGTLLQVPRIGGLSMSACTPLFAQYAEPLVSVLMLTVFIVYVVQELLSTAILCIRCLQHALQMKKSFRFRTWRYDGSSLGLYGC